MSENDLKYILNIILKEDFKTHIDDWLFYAKPNDKKGLYLISKIYKHKGSTVFKEKSLKQVSTDLNDLNYKAAMMRYKNNSFSSTYKTSFVSDHKFLYKNIFQERDLKQTVYSSILSSDTLDFISNWLKNEKTEEYKDYVLDFLRSFYTTYHSNRNHSTVYRDEYHKYQKHETYSEVAVFCENAKLKRFDYSKQKYIPVEEMRKNLKIDQMKQDFNTKMQKWTNLSSDNDGYGLIQQRKQELIKGNKNIIRGIYGNTSTSVYQESFKGFPERHKLSLDGIEKGKYISGVKGKCPDPSIMNLIENYQRIDSGLIDKITKMNS